ncbi:MAG: matrixin family metalloprotease [Candidatus Eisenbacteria bacterium]|uniref:Matrixin family metalloprotease n=1 Tax=Eiseniibacteriota bacterium TaxID=2212470 RepID=A0A538TW74_UNCEI|nr:MAG: matrixin family metalloprotease [Candidatus Eisenbacteria bacterium]
MKRSLVGILAVAATGTAILGVANAYAFRMIQNTNTGRTSSASRVLCDDPVGFVHWTTPSISWGLNAAGQGGDAGVTAAVQNAMAAWNNVSPAPYALTYSGTTNAGFVTDGINVLSWSSGNGCSGGCLAITALVLAPGQVIIESDVSFNSLAAWNTDGNDYDVQAVATHELGHTLGIHHTELQKPRNRPTMYASYFGTAGRSLESDDTAALSCSYTRYPPLGASSFAVAAAAPGVAQAVELPIRLSARPRVGGSILRFALTAGSRVRLDVFDVAGRKTATLLDDFRAPGEYEIAWDGASTRGRAASGFYFARITTEKGVANTTVPLAE